MKDGVSAQLVEAILAGMSPLGVDVATIRARASLPDRPAAPGERWTAQALPVAWMHALQRLPRPHLAAEVGLAVPFGAFGAIDYLTASADTMGGALHALAAHFRGTEGYPRLTVREDAAGVVLEVRPRPSSMPWIGEEFSLGVLLKNFRHIAAAPVPVVGADVTRADVGTGALAALLGTPVRFGRPTAALRFAPAMAGVPLRTADPYLHRVVGALAAGLDLGGDGDPFVSAVRARLRDTLPRGDAGAAGVARALGVSERTLHRRLRERGTTWRGVIDAYRGDESKRLLRDRRHALADIALALGFSDQTAWSRAFQRWTGRSPTQWARGGDAPGEA